MRDEYQCSTLGLLAWLAAWSLCRHSDAEKEQCRAMLEALLCFHAPADKFLMSRCVEKFAADMELCPHMTNSNQPCRDVRYCLRSLPLLIENFNFVFFFAETFGELWRPDCDCIALRPLAMSYFKNVADHIDASVKAMGHADPLKDIRVLKTENGKRRRVDEDWRRAVAKVNVQSGIHAAQTAKFQDIAEPKTIYDTIVGELKAQRVAARETMQFDNVVGMAEDGSGHGKPAESTLLSIIWDAEANVAMAGQPQVRRLSGS